MSLRDELQSDLNGLIFDTDDFAEEVEYRPAIGDPYDIVVLWEDSYEAVDPDTQVAVQSTGPRARTPQHMLESEPGPGDVLVRDGVSYSVAQAQPQYSGVIDLYLHKA